MGPLTGGIFIALSIFWGLTMVADAIEKLAKVNEGQIQALKDFNEIAKNKGK